MSLTFGWRCAGKPGLPCFKKSLDERGILAILVGTGRSHALGYRIVDGRMDPW